MSEQAVKKITNHIGRRGKIQGNYLENGRISERADVETQRRN